MKISERQPFVYENQFQLQMFELRMEFELLFLKQQEEQLVKTTAQQYITKPNNQ